RFDRGTAAPEGKILGRTQRRFQRIEMAEKSQAPAVAIGILGNRHAIAEKLALGGLQQPRHQPQQAGFAAAIRPAQQQDAPGYERKPKPCEDKPLPAPAGNRPALETLRPGLFPRYRHRREASPDGPRRQAKAKNV